MANHLHGYHGSHKDLCIYCGSGDDENKFCQKHTDEENARQLRKQDRIRLAKQAKAKLTTAEWYALYWTLTSSGYSELT